MIYLHSYMNLKEINKVIDGAHFALTPAEIKEANQIAVERYRERLMKNAEAVLHDRYANASISVRPGYFPAMEDIREAIRRTDNYDQN